MGIDTPPGYTDGLRSSGNRDELTHACPTCNTLHLSMHDWRETHRCIECGELSGNEPYAVKDEVWAATGLGQLGGFLHLRCLERRIGRPLTIADFKDASINDPIRVAYEMGRRGA